MNDKISIIPHQAIICGNLIFFGLPWKTTSFRIDYLLIDLPLALFSFLSEARTWKKKALWVLV
jgi:hypothetical protein